MPRRAWRGLTQYGAIFFVLDKLGAVIGVPNLQVYAAMRGKYEDKPADLERLIGSSRFFLA